MPELPEVETVKNGLKSQIIGLEIKDCIIRFNKLRNIIPDNLQTIIQNHKIINIKRRAKYLILELDNNYCIIIHLGMTGRLVFYPYYFIDFTKHDHVIFNFKSSATVVYNDTRRFGLIDFCKTIEINQLKYFKNLGPEPFSEEFNTDYLHNILQKRTQEIKIVIMDQKIVVGVGNIYACESLFMSKINPQTPANKITQEQCESLINSIRVILNQAIKAGGSTLKDYVNSSGEAGYFQNNFAVYGKLKGSCSNCNSMISKITQAGRSTFYCKSCQN